MARVFVIHGVVDRIDPTRFAFRNLIESKRLEGFLRSTSPLLSLDEAMDGAGDALTIDDATQAGADAARLARRFGHQVTLFANPGQVVSGAPYAFVVLNAVLDALDGPPREFESQFFPVASMRDRQALRLAIKQSLRRVPEESARLARISDLAARWGVPPTTVPPHFQTLSRERLIALREIGVDVQNHGWSHGSHATLSAEESLAEVRNGRIWLEREIGVDARYFAVPFGDVLPRPNADIACKVWFTCTDQMRPGFHSGSRVFNREELDLPVGGRGARGIGRPPSSLVAWLRELTSVRRRHW